MDNDTDWNDIFLNADTDYDESPSSSDFSMDSELESHYPGQMGSGVRLARSGSNLSSQETGGNIVGKVRTVLASMDASGITLPIFLHALSWGDEDCIRDAKIRAARTALMTSRELPDILRHWWKPPRSTVSHKSRTRGAKDVMGAFAAECLHETMVSEIDGLAEKLRSPVGVDVTQEHLTSFSFQEMILHLEENAPTLWSLLINLARTQKQMLRNSKKNPSKVVLTVILMISYTRSHHQNRFQKLMAIYLKFRGLSAKGFDTLHALALTTSHKWAANAVGRMSKAAMTEVTSLIAKYPWLISYDNVQIPFRVFSQRLENQGVFGNGTAATVYVKQNATPLSATANRDLQEQRARGMQNPLTALEIFDLATESFPRIQAFCAYEVLRFLLQSPEFDLNTYASKDSVALKPPEPVHRLASGKGNITMQYLLGTVNIPEASYEDHSRLLKVWLSQLNINREEEKRELALEKLIVFAGDQLTVERLRGLFKFCAEDLDPFDRLDWSMSMFGWLHAQMTHANSLHKQYLGTSRGRGLSQAFDLLNRKGLGSVSTKGPFHQNLEEALYHVAEAHIRVAWLEVSSATSLAELRTKSPEDLRDLAEKIVRDHASSEALDRMKAKPKNKQDEVQEQSVMWTRDVLQYIVLDKAIKAGDVGLMEDMLPHLLFRFMGGKNSNYAVEILELLQGLHREWTPEVKDFVRKNCWLVNFTGHPDEFLPIDKAQEHNIKGIKVTYRSEGPNIDWEYLSKLHPAIPIIRALTVHLEREFQTLTRGKRHTTPAKELDVQKLVESYLSAELHKYKAGRKIKSKSDRATDYVSKGCIDLQNGKSIQRWIDGRSFERATTQDWMDSGSSGSAEE